jgi:hypothetical protein
MTIDQAVQWLWVILLVLGLLAIWLGSRRIAGSSRLRFYLLRRERAVLGWRFILGGTVFLVVAVAVWRFGRQAVYVAFPPTPSTTPSPTVTRTPSVTIRPTQTETPRVSLTPSQTLTPTSSVTPRLPEQLQIFFQETITPRADVLFSPVLITDRLNAGNLAVDPREEFDRPPATLYGAFSYENLADGVRWTALWYRGDEIVCYESKPWDGGTGGYGYTECAPAGGWRVGEYEVQMFAGTQWKVSARFTILSIRTTPTLTPTP